MTSTWIKRDALLRTRDGREARVICVDRKGDHPVVALMMNGFTEITGCYTRDGKYGGPTNSFGTHPWDLMPPEPPRWWVNVYPDGHGGELHATREGADKFARDNPKRIACLPFREGDGLTPQEG